MALVLFFAAMHGAAILLFLNGFFLTRFEIDTPSQCTRPPPPPPPPHTTTHASTNTVAGATDDGAALPRSGQGAGVPSHERWCWMPRRYRRALFVVVDALRFDFTLYTRPSAVPPQDKDDEEDEEKKPEAPRETGGEGPVVGDGEHYYVNNLPIINELLLANASNALLFRFVADAPTTTLQRLKAINTGGIPTFLEAKNNFDSSELSEDNLIRQMRDNGRGVVFMGDDTWVKLFPPHKHYFTDGCYPFPSFNVKVLCPSE